MSPNLAIVALLVALVAAPNVPVKCTLDSFFTGLTSRYASSPKIDVPADFKYVPDEKPEFLDREYPVFISPSRGDGTYLVMAQKTDTLGDLKSKFVKQFGDKTSITNVDNLAIKSGLLNGKEFVDNSKTLEQLGVGNKAQIWRYPKDQGPLL